MTPELERVIRAEVEQAARSTVRRWPSLPIQDAVQQGWLLCMAALPRLDPAKAPGPYFGRVLRVGLPRYAKQVGSPVHLPAGREYLHRIAAVSPIAGHTTATPQRQDTPAGRDGQPLADHHRSDEHSLAAAVVEVVEDVTEPERLRPVRQVLLDDADPADVAAEAGLDARALEALVAGVLTQLAHDDRLLELVGTKASAATVAALARKAGARL